MPTRLITPSQLSLFSISPVIGAWWEELEHRPGNCANCITYRTTCDSGAEPLTPGQGLVFEEVEHCGRRVHVLEEIDRLCRISSLSQRGELF